MSYDHCYNGNINGTRSTYDFSSAYNSVSASLFDKPTSYGYKYDKMNRLTSANASVGTFIDAQFANGLNDTPEDSYSIGDESYKYDKIGNILMLSRTLQDTSIALGTVNDEFAYAYAIGTNRLTGIVNSPNTALNRSYTYDDNGNLLTDDFRHLESTVYGRSSYAFSIAKPSGEDIEYLYDHNDQRVFKKDVTSAQTTLEYYIKDAMGRDLAIVRSVTTDTTGAVATEFYAYGSDRIAKINPKSASSDTAITGVEATFFLYDHLGNNRVAFTLDSSNTVVIVNAMDYFPYGKILREFDNGDGNRFLTTQHERDKETGLDYRGARYYDSDVARFLSLDPSASKYPYLTAYSYVSANPIAFIDPDGRDIIDFIKTMMKMAPEIVPILGKSAVFMSYLSKFSKVGSGDSKALGLTQNGQYSNISITFSINQNLIGELGHTDILYDGTPLSKLKSIPSDVDLSQLTLRVQVKKVANSTSDNNKMVNLETSVHEIMVHALNQAAMILNNLKTNGKVDGPALLKEFMNAYFNPNDKKGPDHRALFENKCIPYNKSMEDVIENMKKMPTYNTITDPNTDTESYPDRASILQLLYNAGKTPDRESNPTPVNTNVDK